MSELEIERIDIDLLVPWRANARTHSEEQVLQIANSIREFGWTNPVLIDGDERILAGHGRVMAARMLGIYSIPCLRLGHLNAEQRRAYVLADNQLALKAGWNIDLLKIELDDLRDLGFDLDLIGFDDAAIDAAFNGDGGGKDDPANIDEYSLKVWSKDENEVLRVKRLLGLSPTAAKVEAATVIGMLRG